MPSIKHQLLQNHNGLLYFSTNNNNIILTKCNTLSFTLSLVNTDVDPTMLSECTTCTNDITLDQDIYCAPCTKI